MCKESTTAVVTCLAGNISMTGLGDIPQSIKIQWAVSIVYTLNDVFCNLKPSKYCIFDDFIITVKGQEQENREPILFLYGSFKGVSSFV